ncbi:MAG: Hsp20/alpha crystallin family protein [bacterium]
MSFFDKLKIKTNQTEEVDEEKEVNKQAVSESTPILQDNPPSAPKIISVTEKEDFSAVVNTESEEAKKKKWFESEGQLAVDFYQTPKDFVVQTAIAGIDSKDLEILIEKDTVIIRGRREKPAESTDASYFYQECYWGPFSREIILPQEVDTNRSEADMKDGILTIKMAKIDKEKKKITIKTD